MDPTDRDIVLVEDIVDSGNTMVSLLDVFRARKVASVKLVSLFDKPGQRTAGVAPDYHGFTIGNDFIVGYGLDYADNYRSLPYVGILKPEMYQK